ncbi:MAG: hypothetical protein V2A79_12235 [Planctomycetota bacterium]
MRSISARGVLSTGWATRFLTVKGGSDMVPCTTMGPLTVIAESFRTNCFGTLPATDGNLEFALKLEADRMVNSFLAQKDLDSEMTVVRAGDFAKAAAAGSSER